MMQRSYAQHATGINLSTFMWGKQMYKEYTNLPPVSAPPIYVLLSLSVMSTLSAQVVAYPLYSVKVNLQVRSTVAFNFI